MEKENLFENEATTANMKLSEKMNDNTQIPQGMGDGEKNSVTETNLKIQEAFYNENNQDEAPPTYVTNETAAIKVTGNGK